MTHSIKQIISLATYGNELLKGNIQELDINSISSFKGCSSFEFVSLEKASFFSRTNEVVLAKNTSEWFDYLKTQGCKELKIHNSPTKVKSFQKGQALVELVYNKKNWLLETVHDNGSDFWSYRWGIDMEKYKKNITEFNVTYGRVSKNQSVTLNSSSFEDSRKALENSLKKIMLFAEAHKQDKWKKQFEFAIRTLKSDNPESNFPLNDITPSNMLNLNASQLLYASSESWAFSPHHTSWAHLKFKEMETRVKHLKLNIDLYDSIIQSISSAINSNKTAANKK